MFGLTIFVVCFLGFFLANPAFPYVFVGSLWILFPPKNSYIRFKSKSKGVLVYLVLRTSAVFFSYWPYYFRLFFFLFLGFFFANPRLCTF